MTSDQLHQMENCFYNITAYPSIYKASELAQITHLSIKELTVSFIRIVYEIKVIFTFFWSVVVFGYKTSF